jgi:hypothetical protein
MTSRLIGADKLRRRLKALETGRPILKDIQIKAVAEAKARVARKTGHTARTIVPGALGDRFTIVEAAGAAVFLEGGTKPHVIRPRKAGMLAWPANASGRRLSGRARTASGRMIFARVVHHPGTKPQPFLLPGAIAAVRSVGIESIVDAWNDAA